MYTTIFYFFKIFTLPSESSIIWASSRIFLKFSVSASAVGGKSAAVSIRSVALDSPNAVFKEAECASTSAPLFASSLAASKQVPLAGSPPTPPHTMVNGVSPILFSRST